MEFTFAVELENGQADPYSKATASYLIGETDAATAKNRQAALKRIVDSVNEANNDSDLVLDGDTIRSTNGRTLSVGDMHVFEATSLVISNFAGTPASQEGMPASRIIFDLDGKEISFEASGYATKDAQNAYKAIVAKLGDEIYDNNAFLKEEDYPYAHDSAGKYILKQSGTSLTIIKLNTSTVPDDNRIEITDFHNNQSQYILSFDKAYDGEATTINIDGKDITFSGNVDDAIEKINDAGIKDVYAIKKGKNILIAKNNEDPLSIRYVNDDNTGAVFTNLPTTASGTSSSFFLGDDEITFAHGDTEEETAERLAEALKNHGTVDVSDPKKVIFHAKDHDNLKLRDFSTDGTQKFSVGSVAGSRITGSWDRGYVISDMETRFTLTSATNGTETGSIGRSTTPSTGTPVVDPNPDLTSGLYMHYAFSGNPAADQKAFVKEAATLENGATIVGGAVHLIGKANDHIRPVVNGGQYVSLPTQDPDKLLLDEMSVSIWVNEQDILGQDHGEAYVELLGGYIRIFHNDTPSYDSNETAPHALGYKIGSNTISVAYDDSDKNSWANYTMTYDKESFSAYRNGVLITSIPSEALRTPDDITFDRNALGRHWYSDGSSARFIGYLDEFRVYNRSLTEGEVGAMVTSSDYYSEVTPKPYVEGISTETVTLRGTGAKADVSSVRNADGGYSSSVAPSTLTEEVGYVTSKWKDDGQRSANIVGSNPEQATIYSQEHSGRTNESWASVSGVAEIYTDPEFDFTFRSTVSGKGTDGGAFYQDANKAVELDYRTQKARQKTFITDFDNVTGERISFSLQGVAIEYTVHADSGNLQKDNSWALYEALKEKSDELKAAGISFNISPGDDGVYVFNDKGGDIVFSGYSGSAATDSGFTLRNIDNDNEYFVLHENTDDPDDALTSAVMKTFTAISQIDYRTQQGAQSALVILKSALNQVSKVRADIGAFISVLENQTTAVQIQSESYQAAESRISDIDVATEMTNFVRNQILTQAAVAMLTQANTLPQMALRLLQS